MMMEFGETGLLEKVEKTKQLEMEKHQWDSMCSVIVVGEVPQFISGFPIFAQPKSFWRIEVGVKCIDSS
jgi:hypothetical protein